MICLNSMHLSEAFVCLIFQVVSHPEISFLRLLNNDIDVNEHERLYNFTLRHKLE